MATGLGGIDALIFTAGIREHTPEIRQRVCENAAWLGVNLDQGANLAGAARISGMGSRTSVWVIPTDEDLMIARHAWALLDQGTANSLRGGGARSSAMETVTPVAPVARDRTASRG